jgi:cytochrome c oxidase cbb3-type subunit 3
VTPIASLMVALVTLLNIGGALWLLWWTRTRRAGDGQPGDNTTGHVWDSDLREYNNPLPRWWLWLFILSIVFGLVYLALYPGLGNFAGAKHWSEIKQYQDQSRQADAVLAMTFAPFGHASVTALAHDDAALRIGRNLFLNNCGACHGSDARGAPGFPNLTDHDWLWGGDPDTVLATIRNGRTGVMPAWRPVLGDAGVENVLAYVMSLSGRSLPAGDVGEGKRKFAEICAACHGADGKGNRQIGAPNLTDSIWLYGGSVATVRESIANGRQEQMPAHLARLGEVRTKLLAAYVLSLGGAELPIEHQASKTAAPSEHTP